MPWIQSIVSFFLSGLGAVWLRGGDDRDNSDSKAKLQLGRQWQACAGQEQTRYFMVFKNRDFGLDGAYTVEEFAEVLREL